MVEEVTEDPGEARDVAERKRALRAGVRAARAALSPAERAAAATAATGRLEALPDLRRARVVLAYAATAAELDVDATVAALRDRGTQVCLPRVAGDHLEVVATTLRALRPGHRGISEPDGPARVVDDLDVVLLPGVAFDLAGGRLGQGGGHYDRLLGRLPERTVRIGVGFACQLVPRVPTLPHDEPVDLVVTDRVVHATGARVEPRGG